MQGEPCQKNYNDHKGLLRTIDNKIPKYANHASNAGVLGQVVSSASASPLLVAGSAHAGLFGAGVVQVSKAVNEGIQVGVDLHR